MQFPMLVVPLFAATVIASGCANSEVRSCAGDYRYELVRLHESYYRGIEEIASAPACGDSSAASLTAYPAVSRQLGSGAATFTLINE